MEKWLAAVTRDLEISKVSLWTPQGHAQQEAAVMAQLEQRGTKIPLLTTLTPCSVSEACTEQLTREKQRQRSLPPVPVPEGLYPYYQALSLFLSLWLPFKHMTLPCSYQHLMVEIQDVGFVSVVPVSWWSPE